jgi:1,4-alpha-glucan branching enzyme
MCYLCAEFVIQSNNMIKKQFLKTKPVCKVTFSIDAEATNEVENVQLVGDFSKWLDSPIDMKKQKDGSFKASVELETGKEYHFRYLLDGQRWENDGTADAYAPAGVSYDENSVVTV